MVKKIIAIIMALSLVGTMGCTIAAKTTGSSSASVKTLREAKIGRDWVTKQMEITLGKELPIVLKLTSGDKVDGYFYLEKGDDVDFNITGNSLIYTSQPKEANNPRIPSDRFSFTASTSQGLAYTLTLSNPTSTSEQPSKLVIFLEIIYPATASVFVPAPTD